MDQGPNPRLEQTKILAPNEISIEKVRETYYTATATASTLGRQLAFAGIAIVWVLSGSSLTNEGGLSVQDDLLWVSALLILGLAVDLLQYLVRAAVWGVYGLYLERNRKTKGSPATLVNWIPIAFFVTKMFLISSAYVLLLVAVLDRLNAD